MRRLLTSLAALAAWLLGQIAAAQELPGPGIVEPSGAGRLFVAICLDTQTHDQAVSYVQGLGMVPNPSGNTGTYFHTEGNLSLNLSGGTCSIVFAADGDGTAAMAAFLTATDRRVSDGDAVLLSNAGQAYIRGGVPARW